MSRKIILIKQELLLLVYELNRSGLLAENEKIRPILAQLEKLLQIGRAVQQECRDRTRMPSSAWKTKRYGKSIEQLQMAYPVFVYGVDEDHSAYGRTR